MSPEEQLTRVLASAPDVTLAVLFGSAALAAALARATGRQVDVVRLNDAPPLLRFEIARGYAMLDYRRVQREAREGLPVIRVFLDKVARAAGL